MQSFERNIEQIFKLNDLDISSKANSLVNSMLSLTIGDQIKNERKTLNATKLDALRKATLESQRLNVVKPSRPKQKGINSEVIIERKLADGKSYRCNLKEFMKQKM